MSAKKRILFIANEMSPYLELTEFSEVVNRLAIKANDANYEVRCIMPRFGTSTSAGTGFMKWYGFPASTYRSTMKIFPCK
jgi:hypothetical protein